MQEALNIQDQIYQWATFRLDGEIYGINVMQVKEVLRYTEITPVPGAAECILGIINLRGNVVTVLDTRNRLGLPEGKISDDSRIVVIDVTDQVVGLLVDSVAEVVYLKQSDIETTPNIGSDDSSRYIQGVCNKNNELIILVDLDSLLAVN